MHFARESNNNNRPVINVQGSTYRPLAPQSYNPYALKPNNYMASSLPLRLSQYNQANISGP